MPKSDILGLLWAFLTPLSPPKGPHGPTWPNYYLFRDSGVSKKPTVGLLLEPIRKNRPEMALLDISKNFCVLIFDQNKRHKGLISVIKQNGHMLPLSWCARNKNTTLFLYQTNKMITFFTFPGTLCIFLTIYGC